MSLWFFNFQYMAFEIPLCVNTWLAASERAQVAFLGQVWKKKAIAHYTLLGTTKSEFLQQRRWEQLGFRMEEEKCTSWAIKKSNVTLCFKYSLAFDYHVQLILCNETNHKWKNQLHCCCVQTLLFLGPHFWVSVVKEKHKIIRNFITDATYSICKVPLKQARKSAILALRDAEQSDQALWFKSQDSFKPWTHS